MFLKTPESRGSDEDKLKSIPEGPTFEGPLLPADLPAVGAD